MYHDRNEKRQTTHVGKSRTTKSRKNQNARCKGNIQILENIGSWHHKQVEMKKIKIKKEYLRITSKLLETKLNSRNLIKRINACTDPFVRYTGPLLKRTREEFKQVDQRTRKLMAIHKALYPRDYIDRLYVSRKEGVKGLASIEESVDISMQRLEDNIEKRGE